MQKLASSAALLLLSADLLTVGCNQDDSIVERGYIEYADAPFMMSAPAKATRGVPFTISVSTYGSSCVTLESTDVTATEEGALIVPYDRRRTPSDGAACLTNLNVIGHPATVTIDTAGMKLLVVRGHNLDVHLRETTDVEQTQAIQIE